ncbi:heterokaryon incompatibility protein-domain-containing protein, partial [Leptodontidium sp. 2 PMI_412]
MAETTKNPSSVSLYSPLASENEIRLLCLLSGVGEDPIECTLQHANLEHNPNYEALSYVWGSPTSSESIEISGKEYFIRENLSSALQHLRHPQNARLFWIDALCINQEEVSERNDQVHQMGRIYRSAVKVIVWLGPSD